VPPRSGCVQLPLAGNTQLGRNGDRPAAAASASRARRCHNGRHHTCAKHATPNHRFQDSWLALRLANIPCAVSFCECRPRSVQCAPGRWSFVATAPTAARVARGPFALVPREPLHDRWHKPATCDQQTGKLDQPSHWRLPQRSLAHKAFTDTHRLRTAVAFQCAESTRTIPPATSSDIA
jgi:hypothetical protein